MKGTHITPRQVRNALAAVFLLLLLLFLSLFQWYQRADTRLEDIAAQNGWDCLGAADRLATHLKRGTYDYMTIDAIATLTRRLSTRSSPHGASWAKCWWSWKMRSPLPPSHPGRCRRSPPI